MAQAGQVAQQQRRPNQDYTSAWHLFTERQWTRVSSKLTLREKAECVLEEAWLQLGMRLPSETTLATFTAVCFLLSSDNATTASTWQLATSYQTVKSVWKSLSKRLLRVPEVEPRAPFLQVLPQNFNQLPQELRLRFGTSLPATVVNRPVQDQDVALLTARVPMRSQSSGHVAAPGSEGDAFQRAMVGFMHQMSARQQMQPDLLPGLQIFRQSGRQAAASQQQLPATPTTAASVAAAPQLALPAPPAASAAPQLALPAPAALPSTLVAGSTEAPQPQDSPREQALALANQVPQPGAEPASQVASVPSAAGLASLLQERRDLEKEQKVETAQGKEQGPSEETTKKSTKPGLKARPAACPGLLKRPAAVCQVQEPPAKKQRPEPETLQKPRKQKPEAATCASTKAGNKYSNETAHAVNWGVCKVEYYTHKSYIRKWEGGKLKMIIGACSGDHQKVCHALWPHVKKGASLAKLQELREKLMSR
ncbi:unnamed protein product [Symbiodinium sp. CCMP2592]|nr:unnamed protein product [Symbiodinium sp. CCMP2592]